MNVTNAQPQLHIKKAKKYSKTQLKQMSIIFAFFLLSILMSILLSLYFTRLPLAVG